MKTLRGGPFVIRAFHGKERVDGTDIQADKNKDQERL